MNENNEENRIKELFAQLRQADERMTPSFVHDWQMAEHRAGKTPQRRNVFRFALAVAVAMVLFAFAAVVFRRTPRQTSAGIVQSNMAISEWRSPTAFLLTPVGEELFETSSQSRAPDGNL